MSKILVYTDNHFTQYSSILRSRGIKYSRRLENQIQTVDWVEKLAQDSGCDEVICLGDFFDKEELNSEELTALQDIKWSELPNTFIVGNHESGLSSLNYSSTKALENKNGTIISTPSLRCYDAEKVCILCIPYITEEDRKSILEYRNKFKIPAGYKLIILSHNDIKGVQYGAFLSTKGFDIKDIEDNCDLFINGHIHNKSWLNNKKTILNLGNVTGLNFSEDAALYPHQAAILDLNTLELTFVDNPYALNFYKLEIKNEQDIEKLKTSNHLKSNAVLVVKCLDTLLGKLRDFIDNSDKQVIDVLEYRMLTFKNEEEAAKGIVDNKLNNNADYLKQFNDFIIKNMGSSSIVVDELTEICK